MEQETNNINDGNTPDVQEKKNTKLFIGAIILIILLVGGGAYLFLGSQNEESSEVGESQVFNASVEAPSLERELTFPANFPEEARQIALQNQETLSEALTENPTDFASWLDLAILYKTVEDFEGAEEIWLFLNEAVAGQSISFHNLGNLYHLHLQDFEEAEAQYEQAIENTPTNLIHYFGLHELYRYSYKTDSALAVDTLVDALEVAAGTPGEIDVYVTLGSYYKEKGDRTNAIENYTKARDGAEEFGNEKLVTQLETEIRALQQ